jgi:peptidoglycan/xylan/chitin deacetylase (PgdA/CDA1 family)
MKKKIIELLSQLNLINDYFAGIATIFMLHRVDHFEKEKLLPNENMKVSPEFLENLILELKKSGYSFISLDELYEILINQKKTKKCIIFTLDDGYKDNCEIAYPIFKEYNVPFTIYLTTSFPNQNVILWWYILEDLILARDFLEVGGEVYACKSYEDKNKVFLKIRENILSLNQENLVNELDVMFKDYKIDWFGNNGGLCMSWEDVISISRDPLCTIGGHTVNHYAFNKLSEEVLIAEIMNANEEIEKKINKKVEHFAYPFGSQNEVIEREMRIVESLNFKTVTTTRHGNIYLEHKNFINCCLPRIMLTENFDIKDIGKIRRKRLVSV